MLIYKNMPEVRKLAEQPTIDEVLSEKDSEILQFVNEQILSLGRKIIRFEGNGTPPLSLINECLMTHSSTMLALQSLYESARLDLLRAKKVYDAWHAQKYVEVKAKYVAIEKTSRTEKTVWLSKDEIELRIIADYKDDYLLYQNQIDEADEKRSCIQRLIDTWNSYGFSLNQLSRNAIAEMNSNNFGGKTVDFA